MTGSHQEPMPEGITGLRRRTRSPRRLSRLSILAVLLLVGGGCATEAEGEAVASDAERCDSSVEAFPGEALQVFPNPVVYSDLDGPHQLPMSDASEEGFDSERLSGLVEFMSGSPTVRSLLVANGDSVVLEQYFHGANPARASNLHSLTKSLLSLVVGAAIADGHIQSVDSTVGDLLPDEVLPDNETARLTVRDLLTMTAGLDWEDDEVEMVGIYDDEIPLLEGVLRKAVLEKLGSVFVDNSGLSQVLSAIVTEKTGQSLCAYAQQRVFTPIGITTDHWKLESDGYFAGGHGLFLTPRELVKVGQFVLNGGATESEQVVPVDWINESTDQPVDLGCWDAFADCSRDHPAYGYHWWTPTISGLKTVIASGFGGQYLLIVPELDLVAVVTHDTRTDVVGAPGPAYLLREFLIPAARS